jgi:hypothetical protein
MAVLCLYGYRFVSIRRYEIKQVILVYHRTEFFCIFSPDSMHRMARITRICLQQIGQFVSFDALMVDFGAVLSYLDLRAIETC